jgi:hypothetical protein
VVIDDKGGEVMHKDKENMTNGENFDIGENMKVRRSIKILNTQVGGASS